MEQYDADYLEDHIKGLIYGNAIGDAIGLLTEFMVKEEAKRYYGDKKQLEFEHKVPDMHRQRFVSGDWTDDTDQMILIMMSIIDKCGKVSAYDFGSKLKNWAQKGFSELGDLGGMGIGSTTSHVLRHQLYDTDPHAAAQSIWEESGCSVAPNGALMRTSVLGAFQFNSLLKVKENTLEICKVTHFDPRCQASTVAMTTAIALMLQRFPDVIKKDGSFDVTAIVKNAYDSSKLLLAKKAHRKELKWYMHKKKLSSLKLCEYKNIGYTYKCLGAGFWALKQDNFRDALQEIVMEAGDADTNGAVAGALLGCKLGAKNLPEVWMNSLIYKEWLDVKIDRFLPLIIPSYVRKFEDGYVPVILSKKIE